MSLKPTKKSDQGKAWLSSRRDNSRKIQPEYHLIITEGENTEPKYFEAVKEAINKTAPGRIQLEIFGEGDNTVNLFTKAKARAAQGPNVYKHIWIVYDTDDFPAKDVNLTAELCRNASTEARTFHAIWSNQCIELWFLLHFSYMHSDLHRRGYLPKLSEKLKSIGAGEYRKNRDDMFAILLPRMETAISNAKRLHDENGEKAPADSTPGTMVYELIEVLKPYLEEPAE